MAKKSMINKQQAEPKFSSRRYNRCKICGRPHAYLRNYGICRSRKVRSTAFPPYGENFVRFLAPPFQNEPASLGFVLGSGVQGRDPGREEGVLVISW